MQEYLVTLLGGLVTTLELTLFSLLLGIVLAALMTWVLELRLPVATQLVQLWVLLFTGTPLLIQIFLIYYGPGQFEWLKASPLWPLLKQPWFCAVLALGLNTAAYSTRLFKGALDAIPAGEVEACRALGFNGRQTLWMKVRHAARHLVPAYSNEVILVLKGSSLASTITIMDIMGLAQGLNAQTYDTLAVFGVAGGLYLAMNGLLTIGFRWCEKRALAFQS
ncbi:arginine ABC transporter permease ArtM [Aeromonas veronii]|jgi:arginine transport system permease protein|uniref:Arginine ABC transporter permease protein ArtM n=5 Tax=Aeromonas TaxID=642 RepID=A0A0T6Q8P4_AERVE|nr:MULTISPECIES: arginine ABC transporter permease ArtM [Aeromonas]MCR6550571.1 arginine ABC transporter permease ArtM [Aeromonas sp. CPF2-S1]HDN9002455.1 arginine ABC transporter permease ArtM [Aeromonas veronii AMC24]AEB51533.1 ABC-type arginine transporter, permease protein [Aeromonas veronii B565]AMQ44537.1 arginine transporter permease subunit ArtM [Aeromonas veronii]ANB52932.1 arginine transporter permease subunit ArtM [Aeromonas veronii]